MPPGLQDSRRSRFVPVRQCTTVALENNAAGSKKVLAALFADLELNGLAVEAVQDQRLPAVGVAGFGLSRS